MRSSAPMRLVLASASPRRRDLLAGLGLRFDVEPAEVDERRHAGEPAAGYVERLARAKAAAVARRRPADVVLGADTVVVVDEDVLGKPIDASDARRMLVRLSGRGHDVLTGVAVASGNRTESRVERTVVWFRALSDADIDRYVATGEPMDKAGAYAIQGGAGAFVLRLEGSYSNVVGLPTGLTRSLLVPFGPAGPAAGSAE